MDKFEMQYAQAKQLPTATEIHTNYGDIPLDDEMRQAVEDALSPIFERRLAEEQDEE